jgi:dehydrogenase/reductase SDR family member 12
VHVAATTGVDSRPETVFDAMADARNEARWNSRVSSAELRSDEPIGLGSKFAVVNGGTSYDLTITTYDRPSRLVFEGVGNPDVTIAYTFTASGERTEMASAFDFRPNGISKLLFAVLAPIIRRDVRKQFASFKTMCESSGRPAGGPIDP